jgi:hypothetical protein
METVRKGLPNWRPRWLSASWPTGPMNIDDAPPESGVRDRVCPVPIPGPNDPEDCKLDRQLESVASGIIYCQYVCPSGKKVRKMDASDNDGVCPDKRKLM